MKKLIALILILFSISVFAGSSGYSGGGRSGFSSARSYSAPRSYSSSYSRSSYSRPSYSSSYSRSYSAPSRSYATHSSEVHHHYNGGGSGGGFWSGFMGGYLGGMMSHPMGYQQPVVVAGGVAPVAGGMVADPMVQNPVMTAPIAAPASGMYLFGEMLTIILGIFLFFVVIAMAVKLFQWVDHDC